MTATPATTSTNSPAAFPSFTAESAVSSIVRAQIAQGSWIRKMFEEGARLKAQFGEANVFDLSLGNPILEPPQAYIDALRACIDDPTPGTHRYMPNAGLPGPRKAIADHLSKLHGVALDTRHICMAVGAGGALNTFFRAVLDEGDEVVVLAPYFPEYTFYIYNQRGRQVTVQTDAGFQPDVAALAAALTDRTRIVVVNSPNNPSGVVYGAEKLAALGDLLRAHSAKIGRPVWLVSDEPYVRITYDGVTVPSAFAAYEQTAICTSFSKDLSLPGERIGFIAVSPNAVGVDAMSAALNFSTRVLGFINAPALQQRAIAQCLDATIDIGWYDERRTLIAGALTAIGYELVHPDGAFYLFPKVPGSRMGDVEFADVLAHERVLVVPGTGFGRPGHFRVSYAAPRATLEGAISGFAKAYELAKA